MHNYQIPIIRFPLTVVFVDDNKVFLRSLADYFKDFYNVIAIDSFAKAEDLLANQKDDVLNCIISDNDKSSIDLANKEKLLGLNISFDNIINLIDSTEKYKIKGILVTDYDLGEKNGLELCNVVKNKYTKKILLTGKLEVTKGVDAMNAQVIDRYLVKDADIISKQLHEYIEVLHTAYFNSIAPIPQNVLKNSDLSVLDECEYIDIFEKVIEQESIKEFYLIDKKGNFVLINDKKEKIIFNIHTDKSLNEFVQTHEGEADIKSLIDAVNARNLIPCFGINNEPDDIDFSHWHGYFYKPICKGKYYWNLIRL